MLPRCACSDEQSNTLANHIPTKERCRDNVTDKVIVISSNQATHALSSKHRPSPLNPYEDDRMQSMCFENSELPAEVRSLKRCAIGRFPPAEHQEFPNTSRVNR